MIGGFYGIFIPLGIDPLAPSRHADLPDHTPRCRNAVYGGVAHLLLVRGQAPRIFSALFGLANLVEQICHMMAGLVTMSILANHAGTENG